MLLVGLSHELSSYEVETVVRSVWKEPAQYGILLEGIEQRAY